MRLTRKKIVYYKYIKYNNIWSKLQKNVIIQSVNYNHISEKALFIKR